MNRQEHLNRLKDGEPFDLLVIGGGATGCGIALDAATRGLRVALIERDDFAQGTSSKSTKLVHGGVRYLEKAILKADKDQFNLVREGLRERGRLLRNAPHLAHAIRLMTPVKTWFEAAYIFAGLVLYDLLAGRLSLGRSRLVTRATAQKLFPQLNLDGYVAAVSYTDGQFNDARMAVTLARTAAAHGAVCVNHVEVTGLVKEGGRIRGAQVRDRLDGRTWTVAAKGVVNAAGPFADAVRRLDDPQAPDTLKVSSGIHILLKAGTTPDDLSLMIPSTEDGRVLFMIPWQGHVLFGTTDEPATVAFDPVPQRKDVDYLLRYASAYLRRPVTREDILAVWDGLRPLVFDPKKKSTQELARTHVLTQSPSGLLTMAGGKWTSYRAMAEDAVDAACLAFGLGQGRACVTQELRLLGSQSYYPDGWRDLAARQRIAPDLARSLFALYGDEAGQVLALGRDPELLQPIHPAHPYIGAQVVFAVRREMAEHVSDVLLRRLPLGLVDMAHALEAAPVVAAIMGRELGWDETRRVSEVDSVRRLLEAWFSGQTPDAGRQAHTAAEADLEGQSLLRSREKRPTAHVM
ncbi:FAD-dependent oxidoreductase [Desulfovibrio aerotolerans]|uniref:Glycerol-3-phosphate dehydrogenase n=1 Tax=Solidesulfovibrio aerotolerans TaxID=295255 RepID=A0A7C9MIX6_9BACT|nr:FAD-dependent oxidoreductase [Solidesulfovibrio aerotolerans]MYL83528.1 FAD-dependent oxidoreductase [Solidesulfovibrio aerotolerans]